MQAARAERPIATATVGAEPLQDVILVRIASALRGVTRAGLAGDLSALAAPRLSPPEWRGRLQEELRALAGAGLVAVAGQRIRATEAGISRTAAFLGVKGRLPRVWTEVRDVRLVAKALGLEGAPARRLKALATPDGLRMAIVERAFDLSIKGVPTHARLRSALAAVALEQAFGNQITAGRAGKLGLSAKASRMLAAQLSSRPRDFGTDARLIAALASEHLRAPQADVDRLRLALLRQFIVGSAKGAAGQKAPAVLQELPPTQPIQPAPDAGTSDRPDLAGFALEVRRHAANRAEGWFGDRRAYISHVWSAICEKRPDWGLSEIEFKCMLAEAHRAGHVTLANADLKDRDNIKDLQASALVYKNAVFHFVRVEG